MIIGRKDKRRLADLELALRNVKHQAARALFEVDDLADQLAAARTANAAAAQSEAMLAKKVEQLTAELEQERAAKPPFGEAVEQLSKKQQKKVEGHRLLRVRDSEDAEGDLVFHLHLETYDRRLLDKLAADYNLNLVFVTEYNDYERDESWVQQTPVAV